MCALPIWLIEKLPARVERHLRDGMLGGLQETVKAGDVCLGRVHNVIIGNLEVALQAAQDKAQQSGLRAEITNRSVQGLAGEAALALATIARDTLGKMQPQEKRCLLSGGETTVNVTGSGEGGRNQQLALAFALAIEGLPGVTLLSAATDGGDGGNDAAGAVVNGDTARRARKLDLSPEALLANNDSYHFFQQFDATTGEHAHLRTGPSGTNVMDMQIMLLEKS